jgi:hypothetical protein
MYMNIPLPAIAILGAVLLALYSLFACLLYRKRFTTVLSRLSPASRAAVVAADPDRYFTPLIDKPADHPEELAHATRQDPNDDPDDDVEMIDDEGGSFLLKEAENVVEQIQAVVDHIATRPANPDEVFTKIRAIVSQYTIFENTEYYDAINNFVAVTVQRDCDLALTADDLKALWWKDAA